MMHHPADVKLPGKIRRRCHGAHPVNVLSTNAATSAFWAPPCNLVYRKTRCRCVRFWCDRRWRISISFFDYLRLEACDDPCRRYGRIHYSCCPLWSLDRRQICDGEHIEPCISICGPRIRPPLGNLGSRKRIAPRGQSQRSVIVANAFVGTYRSKPDRLTHIAISTDHRVTMEWMQDLQLDSTRTPKSCRPCPKWVLALSKSARTACRAADDRDLCSVVQVPSHLCHKTAIQNRVSFVYPNRSNPKSTQREL